MPPDALAQEVVELLGVRRSLLATAESLTGGALGAVLTSVPGVSSVYAGGVVSYLTSVKVALLGVPVAVVDGPGVVSAECAQAMAAGVRALTEADLAVSTTGVAGPDPQEDKPVGLVYVGLAHADGTTAVEHLFSGDRESIRAAAVRAALVLVRDHLAPPG